MGNKARRFAGLYALVAMAALAWGSIYTAYGDTGPIKRWAYFATGNSGPTKGYGIGPSPMTDVTGKFKGKTHCYTCDWLSGPCVAAFIKPDDPRADDLAQQLDRLVRERQEDGLRGCTVFLGGKELIPRLEKLAKERDISAPLLYLAPEMVPSYLSINPSKRNTLILIQDHRTYGTFSDLDSVGSEFRTATTALVREPDRPVEVAPIRYPGQKTIGQG